MQVQLSQGPERPMKRGVKADLLNMLIRYPSLDRVEPRFTRSLYQPCLECSGDGRYEDGEICSSCEGEGEVLFRSRWVNSQAAWTGFTGNYWALLMYFRSGPWLSVCLYDEPYRQDLATLQSPRTLASASTKRWNGERAGSAIERRPDSLRGFMWRISLPDDSDHLTLPSVDIISHLSQKLKEAGYV